MLSPTRWFLRRPLARHVRRASNSISTVPRRGRNLTESYRRLENAARDKSERATHISALHTQGSVSTAEPQSDGPTHARTSSPSTVDTIAGFVIPKEPRAPADDECCMSGCAVCVYDLYEDALAAYKDSVLTLRAELASLDIPEVEWPTHLRTGNEAHTSPTSTPTATGKSKGAVFDAFEEMERALREKRDRRAAVEAESSSPTLS